MDWDNSPILHEIYYKTLCYVPVSYTHLKTKKVVGKIFDAINYSKKLKISSILPERDSDYVILLELEDGSKFEIIIIPTRRFV